MTDRFDVVLTGFELTDTRCDVGPYGTVGGCRLQRSGDDLFTVSFEPLEPGDAISVGGPFSALTEPARPPIPAPPGRNPSGLRPLGLLLLAIGAAVAVAGYFRIRSLGSNVVFGSGAAADAAFGAAAVPLAGGGVGEMATYRVPDSKFADLATIEFVPPRGVEPWQGRVLLREEVDDDTVSAWFSEMVALGVIEIDGSQTPTLTRGTDVSGLDAVDRSLVDALFASTSTVRLGSYDPAFSAVWSKIKSSQSRMIAEAGWWDPPLGGLRSVRSTLFGTLGVAAVVAFVVVTTAGGSTEGAVRRFLLGPVGAVVITLVGMAAATGAIYGVMRPSRTAIGSALTLRTESFRRFLVASEGQHVEWAWEHEVIREYSAWAVALDAAEAWSKAIESSNIPDPSVALDGPLVMYSSASSFSSTRTAPSSSGGGGGGGGSGGGGGGGSSGSW